MLILVSLAACGGGGGDRDRTIVSPAPPPATEEATFGLEVRPAFPALSLPDADTALGSYQAVPAFPGLSLANALFLAGVPGENRLAVVEQSGLVKVFDRTPAVAAARTVLDLSSVVEFAGEQGLLGLAFDPDFVDNRLLYVHYSMLNPRRSVVSRFRWDRLTDRVDPDSERVLLEVEQPYANHNGGMLAFGPDGFLYIALGDGGSGGDPLNNAQDTSTLLGSILRLDVHPADGAEAYAIPLDNPLRDDPAARPEIYAWGFRNPFRFSFDRQTGDLWLGDVGQQEIEEIDRVVAGGNYGWRVYEGSQIYDPSLNTLAESDFVPPVYEYDHSLGVAIIGGYVYRGNALPSLQGRYLYTDFGSGTLWALTVEGDSVVANDVLGSVSRPTSFGEDNAGEVYVVSRNAGIFRLEETSGTSGIFPDLLSETGLFSDLKSLVAADGFIPYDLNQPFWSDGVKKRRWVAIPDAATVELSDSDPWRLPRGSVLVKHFDVELTEGLPESRRRLETRVLVQGEQGWTGVTYRWNAAQDDAVLLTGRATDVLEITLADGEIREQRYDYPSRTDCLVCHNSAAGGSLGLKTPQMNRDYRYLLGVDNQLRAWNHVGLFDRDIGVADAYPAFPAVDDEAAALSSRARAYLDVNCANCHRPGGPTPVDLDLRHTVALEQMNVVNVAPAAGDLGITDARIVAPGNRASSVLWQRMTRLDHQRMPPLSSHVVNAQGVALIGAWIDAL